MSAHLHNRLLHIACCIALWLCMPPVWGNPTYIRHLGGAEGLNDLLVNTIHRDTTGLVWLGTGSSVEMFDGIRLTHFPLPESNDFSQRVTAIVGNSSAELFVGNSKGLYSLSAEKNKPIAQAQWQRVGENQIIGAVSDLYLKGETLYIATDHGLYTITNHPSAIIHHHPLHPNELNSANQLRHLCMDKDGILWMTSPVGLHALLPNQQVNHYLYPDLPEGGFNCICYVQDTLLLGTFHSGVYYFSIPNATYGLYKHSVQPISALQAVGHDTLLIATDGGGVQMLNLHSREPLPMPYTSFTSSNVYSMLYDQNQLLWVGYYQQGLDYTVHQDNIAHVYRTSTWDSYGKAVRAFAVHQSHKLIGTRDGLFLIDEQSGQVRTYTEHQLNAQMIFALCYHNNRFYIGTFGGGLYSLSITNLQSPLTNHQSPITNLQSINPEVGSQIFCLTTDSLGLLWVGSEKGVFALKGQQIVYHYDAQSSKLPRGNVYAIFFDRMGRGWFCTQTGMAIYDAELHTVRTDIFPNTFPHQQAIRSIFQDQQGTLYFLPDKGRIFSCNEHLHPKPLKNLPHADGLFITQDAEQHIWLGTTNGLYRYRIQDAQLTLQDYFDFASGLPDNIFTLCHPYWDADSTLWMGHSRGLVYLNPNHQSSITNHQSPIVIDVQQQNGDVTFFFSDLSYTLPQYTHYTYRLKGYELNEHTLNGSSQCSYANLPMGRYTFLLRSSNQPAQEFAYELRVPMSRQDWLILITVLLTLLSIALFVLYLLHRYRYHPKSVSDNDVPDKSNDAYRTFHLTSEQLKSLSSGFCQIMAHDKLYLNSSLRISDVAAKMQVSSYSLSYMLNQYMHINFNDYINRLRIDSFCQRVQKGDAKRFSIDTLAQECGFVSRAGFFRNFKKHLHQTPNEYIQSIKN